MKQPTVVGAEMGFSRSGRGVGPGVVSSWARSRDTSGGRIGEGGFFGEFREGPMGKLCLPSKPTLVHSHLLISSFTHSFNRS